MSGYIKQKLKRTRNVFMPKGIILMYHRIADMDNDPWELSVKPSFFKEQLEVLNGFTEVLPLQDLSDRIINKRSLKKFVAVTFDDGYSDNLHEAKKWLEQYGIPATFFIASGYTDSNKEFWWDELQRLLLSPGRLPKSFHLEIKGLRWDLGEAALLTDEDYHRVKTWINGATLPSQRHHLYMALWQIIRDYPNEKQVELMEQLALWSGGSSRGREHYFPMTKEELVELSNSECVDIGAHTCYHPRLSLLSPANQRKEISEGKKTLETWIKKEVTTFSYPYGNYNQDTLSLVEEAGFHFAYTTQPCLANGKQTRFTLPRFQVKNWNGREFEEHLSNWFERY